MKRLLAMCLALILMLGVVPMQQAEAASVTLTVKGGWLRLREKPDFNADTISSYYTGTKVTVLSVSGAWYCVRTPDNRVGYMYGSYLSASASSGVTGNENITAYVTSKNGKGVRMRTGPGTAYGVVRLYDVGTKVTILSSGTYWDYISINGQKGYMQSQYLTTAQVAPPVNETTSYVAYVTSSNGKGVNLRKGPSTSYGSYGSYAVGTQLTVTAHTGDWSYVTINGLKGYMMTKYLTTEKPSTPVDTTYTAYVTSSNGRGVNLRKGPNTNYGSYGTYDVGTQVTVLSKNGSWSYIDIAGRKGYMMSKYLTTTKPSGSTGGSSVPTSYTAYVTSANGKGVYLRSGAGQTYKSLGLYSVGTQVTVLRHNSTWDYIRIGSREGYMMNKYLTTTKPDTNSYVITGVTLSNAYPTSGETLWANVTPSGANVTYEWMTDNGLLLSSDASYKLTDSDVGRRIRVRVTGKNGYTGSAVSSYATVSAKGTSSQTTAIKSVSIDNGNPTVGDTLTAGVLPTGATANYRWVRDDGVQVGSAKAYTVQTADVGHALYCEVTGTGSYSGTVNSSKTAAVKANTPAATPISGTVDLKCSAIMPGVSITPSVSTNCSSVTYHWYVGGAVVSNGTSLTVTEAMAGKTITLVVKPAEGSGYSGQVESNSCIVLGNPATPTDLS